MKLLDITGLKVFYKGILKLLRKKQDTLISGENIKTINGKSIIGAGDITITGSGSSGSSDINSATAEAV